MPEKYFFHPLEHEEFKPDKMNKVNLYESPQLFCDIYCLEQGQTQKDHTHDENDKIYYCLSGKCKIRIGEESRTVEEGHLAVAPAGVVHGVINNSDARATLLVMMAPHPNFRKS